MTESEIQQLQLLNEKLLIRYNEFAVEFNEYVEQFPETTSPEKLPELDLGDISLDDSDLYFEDVDWENNSYCNSLPISWLTSEVWKSEILLMHRQEIERREHHNAWEYKRNIKQYHQMKEKLGIHPLNFLPK